MHLRTDQAAADCPECGAAAAVPCAELFDRVLALDTMYINGMLILLTLGLHYNSPVYFDVALLICIFGFVGSVAMAKFLLRGAVIEP